MMPIQDNMNIEGRKGDLFLASWNMPGLNNPTNRGNVLAHFKPLSPVIID